MKYGGMISYLREIQNYGNNYVSPTFAGEVADALESMSGKMELYTFIWNHLPKDTLDYLLHLYHEQKEKECAE